MTREERLMNLIKLKYRSLRNFSIESGIPNSTLNSMFKKGIGGTGFDTVFKVCSLLDVDIYNLAGSSQQMSYDDKLFVSKYLDLDEKSKALVKLITEHQLSFSEKPQKQEEQKKAKEVSFPVEKTLTKTVRVYLSAASAGTGEYLEDSDYEDIPYTSEIPQNADFGIAIHGDSMTPDICDGDVVWVVGQEKILENQIGVFVLNGNSLCKKLITKAGRFFLRSLNPDYADIPITEYDELKVIGRVIDATPFPAY